MVGISSLYTGISALHAQRKRLDVIGHNVSNAQTEGYHRQRVDLRAVTGATTSAIFAGRGDGPYGVQIAGMSRSIDDLLAARAAREEATGAQTRTMATAMTRIENSFAEPSDVGLGQQLAEFWSAWNDVANSPGGLATRSQLLERSATLIASIHRTANDIEGARVQSQNRLDMVVTDANTLAQQVAQLNLTITANPTAALDLMDQRDMVVRQLADLVGGEARPAPGGQISVYVGGRAIVSGVIVQELRVDTTREREQLRWFDGTAAEPTGGEAAALVKVIDEIAPRYAGALDGVVQALVTKVNEFHRAGFNDDHAPPDLTTGTGLNFFDRVAVDPPTDPPTWQPVTAMTLRLSDDVAGKPQAIAARSIDGGVVGGPLDGSNAARIAGLMDAPGGPDEAYRAMIAELAVDTRAAIRRHEIQQHVMVSARNDADSVGAVSLDEEMVALVEAQRAFEAAARFITVVDELLATLMRTGVVGR